jgi:hypothetical protein
VTLASLSPAGSPQEAAPSASAPAGTDPSAAAPALPLPPPRAPPAPLVELLPASAAAAEEDGQQGQKEEMAVEEPYPADAPLPVPRDPSTFQRVERPPAGSASDRARGRLPGAPPPRASDTASEADTGGAGEESGEDDGTEGDWVGASGEDYSQPDDAEGDAAPYAQPGGGDGSPDDAVRVAAFLEAGPAPPGGVATAAVGAAVDAAETVLSVSKAYGFWGAGYAANGGNNPLNLGIAVAK